MTVQSTYAGVCDVRDNPVILIVDDDKSMRDSLGILLRSVNFGVRVFASAHHLLAERDVCGSCLITDLRMPDLDGIELQKELLRRNVEMPVIVMTGHGDVAHAVRAMKAGAIDFIEKPLDENMLLTSVRRALEIGNHRQSRSAEARNAKDLVASLTPREKSVLEQLVKGNSNKVAAHELGISARTIEIHRANIMGKTNARSLSDLVRIAVTAERVARDTGKY